ncbi:unnamed protein product [Parnassius apollo]|uniref:(apollo) hypothetical protein n=1 Tax=Parnassius apollo TaxID=110799 RepID=A0A8S3WPN6_PARAO|nr:unnamed protein product [Parnassius apollo]
MCALYRVKLLQDQANTISEGLPAFGHRSICFTCGISILRATRTYPVRQDRQERNILVRHVPLQLISRLERQVYVNELFPYLDNNKIQFPSVQRQPNNRIECGLFAICFVTALALRVNPSCINFIAEDMPRHLFDMLSRGLLELFPSTNTARRAGRPPANLFLNILAKKEKCKIKDAEKKKKQKVSKDTVSRN